MSQENVELVAEGLREFQATLRAAEPAAADFVWDLSTLEGWPDAVQYVGPEGFNEFIAKWTEAYDEFEQRTEELFDAGGQDVVSIISQRGRPRGSQSWVHLRFGVVWTVADGEIKRGRVFRTAEEALEAAGLGK
jgi:ketosteroid isomerase-like protein